ncbi:MAG: hypothetical protein JSR37_06925 [Verrucomicrobia bacterium]|nr:hypothetical protein [Verrucomicrobiota bacterium]MBS0638019.1 hypothetical protein [Verrucomicrobiota bacterium]
MSISKDNYMRLFQSIDNVSESTKAGKKGQEAGVKAYDLDKMGPARKFFAKKMGIEYKTAEGKVVYLDKTSLSKFLARNKAIASEKEFDPKTCIEQLKNLHVPIASKIQVALKEKSFEISETDLKAICRGLGMDEKNTDTFVRLLDGWKTDNNRPGETKEGRHVGTEREVLFVVEKGDPSRISSTLANFLVKHCKPEPMLKPSFEMLINGIKGLA